MANSERIFLGLCFVALAALVIVDIQRRNWRDKDERQKAMEGAPSVPDQMAPTAPRYASALPVGNVLPAVGVMGPVMTREANGGC